MTDEDYWLIYRGLSSYLGIKLRRLMQHRRGRFIAMSPRPYYCALCGRKIEGSRKKLSIDHIIPVTICYELEMPGLIYDWRNFRLTHSKCNGARADDISNLPPEILDRIRRLRNRALQ